MLFISATHKSSGKTTVTLGLCAALQARGLVVQPFKKGPDYIDPLWLTQAAGRPCHNLDFYTMSADEIVRNVAHYSTGADVSLIEGNKGLYDGLDVDGSNSNAALAHLLGAPVILVIDTQGMTRGVVPLILGYQRFDPNIHIAGIILNQVGGPRHEGKLRTAIERYTTVPVLGAIQRDSRLNIEERHLGLIPSNEDKEAQQKIMTVAELVSKQVNLNRLLNLAKEASVMRNLPLFSAFSPSLCLPNAVKPDRSARPVRFEKRHNQSVKIGVIRDAAFGFYYPGDLIAMEEMGAHLVFIDALHDAKLPKIDGLFIGGGFPEENMEALFNNQSFRTDLKVAIEQGLPVYAECGGLMYLSRQLTWQGKTYQMVGALPCDTVMENRPQGRGYVQLRETGQGLWPLLNEQGQPAEFYAHEFHYSRIVNLPSHLPFAYEVLRGEGLDGRHDGLIYKNTLACYVHLREVENNRWTQRFVEFVRKVARLQEEKA